MKTARDLWELPRQWFQLVANPVSQGIEFDLDAPLYVAFVNLAPLFGYKGLDYQVMTDTPGVVHCQIDPESGLLFLFPELENPLAGETMVIVRSERTEGESSYLNFQVRVQNQYAKESLLTSA